MTTQKKEVLFSSIRTPQPRLVFAETQYGCAYAWECDHKSLGIRVLGDSKKEAIDKFSEALIGEALESNSEWLNVQVINDLDPQPNIQQCQALSVSSA